ncbi:glycosyltransferase family 90 protein [Marinilongibacter aquaticus]|uniref:glycosyltransferase family 90 protein n=1 Tax=Marinilongibacter aquaticus TaxID=2975157 RepID=UPI0021BD92A3|nr:glycosyltransferase family 90 protein [Marinilongibacter aquaticus]UBM58414.1 glycosyltransferase family 90 protein [Marinilongibacter aquaticus]
MIEFLDHFLIEIKRSKFIYYIEAYLRAYLPADLFRESLDMALKKMPKHEEVEIWERVNYYNKLESNSPLQKAVRVKDLRQYKKPKVYYFDLYKYARYFNKNLRIRPLFGDVIHVEAEPCIQKTRPIGEGNHMGVLMKLNAIRHFQFVSDRIPFREKRNLLVGRGNMHQEHRLDFMEKHFDNVLCDIGDVNEKNGQSQWLKPKMSIKEHLKYKFILSLEGNDVATNLKWIMSSNSIAVMPKPKYESWFMEGKLIADFHYIAIKEDYSDLQEKLKFYIANTEKAEAIVANAQSFVRQFEDSKKEKLISLLVLKKYFEKTGQSISF